MADNTIARTFNVGEELGKNPAFPCDGSRQSSGLSIRDYFAAAALQGLLSNPNVVEQRPDCRWSLCNITEEGLAEEAYAQADAMLQERVK